jgi:hypothetical protein
MLFTKDLSVKRSKLLEKKTIQPKKLNCVIKIDLPIYQKDLERLLYKKLSAFIIKDDFKKKKSK